MSQFQITDFMMSQSTTDEQVRKILLNPIGCRTQCSISLPRLRLALDLQEREFIAGRRCQNVVMKEWYGKWSDWIYVPPYVRLFRIISHTLFYPIVSLIYVFTLGKYPKSSQIPFARFLNSTAAHVYFVIAIVFNMQYQEARDCRGPPDNKFKQFLYLWIWMYVANQIFVMITGIWRLGFNQFSNIWWRWFDACLNLMQFATMYAYIVAWAEVSTDGIRYAHRSHWPPSDPVLVFELLFAISSILSIWRFFYYLQLIKDFGPFMISMGRCFKDVALYVAIIGVILFSCSIGLNYLYEHYKYNTVIRNGIEVEQPMYMCSIYNTFRYLFWSLYGYLPPENLAIVVGNSGPDNTETLHENIASAGEFLVAFHHIVVNIILVNLMVSMMTRSAAIIMDNENLEWIYLCTHLRAEYFMDSRSLAPPFGLIQLTVNGAIYTFRKVTGRMKDKIISVWDWRYIDPIFTQQDYENYLGIIRLLKKKELIANGSKFRSIGTGHGTKESTTFKIV